MAAHLDRGTVEFLDKEVFTDVTAGERHEVDLLAQARFRGREAFFLVHVEAQSKPQEAFGRRMFTYFARLHEKFALPVYPIVVFSYDAPLREEPDRYRVEFPDKTVLDFSYRVIQLNRLNWREFLRHPNPAAAALMAKMHVAPEDRPRVKLECLRMITTLKLNPAKSRLISEFVDTYLRLTGQEQALFDHEWRQSPSPEREAIMAIMTSWEEKGLARGRGEGREEALRDVAGRLLRHRFGELPTALVDAVARLPVDTLEQLAEAILDFGSLADAEAWVAARS